MVRRKSKPTRKRQRFECVFFVLIVLAAPSLIGQSGTQLTPAETKILSSLDPDRTGKEIQHLSTGIVDNDSGAGAGSATGGSADEKKIADAVEQEMKSIGLTVHTEPFPVRHYDFGKVNLRANGTAIEAISLYTGGGTWGAKDGVPYAKGNAESGHVLRAALVASGNGNSPADEKFSDMRGKAVLAKAGDAGISEVAQRCAAALVLFDDGDGPEDALGQNPAGIGDQLPTVLISKKNRRELAKRIQDGPVSIELENRIDSGDGTSYNVIGTLQGTEFPDEWVMVSAHYDRWWHSANDNEAGVASMLEIARALSGSYQPKRSVMFLATGSEEVGLVGSGAFVQAHPEVMRRLVYDRNFDLSGWTATKGRMLTSPEIAEEQKVVIADLGLSDRITVIEGQDIGTDAWNFGAVGGGGTSLLVWNSRMLARDPNWDPKVEPDPFWKYSHTQLDLYRPEDYGNLLTELKVSTLSVLRMSEVQNVPIRLTEVASWAKKTIDSDAATATDVSFDDVRTALTVFQSEAERVESLQQKASTPTQVRVMNDILLNSRKDLMPSLYSDSETSFRTTGYANSVAAIKQARIAAKKGDRAGVVSALERVQQQREFSELGSYWQERLGSDAPDVATLLRDLNKGGHMSAQEDSLRRLETQAKADLSRSLSIAARQLRAATEILRTARLD